MAAIDDATAKRVAAGLSKYGWLGTRSQAKAGWRRRLIDAIQEFAEPEPVMDAEFMARAEAECGEAWVHHWNEIWRTAFDSEKGDAMDDATAKRIAEHLRASGIALDVRVMGGKDQLAVAIQEAAEPPAMKPGLYFVHERPGGTPHLEDATYHADGAYWRDVMGDGQRRWEPGGQIVSGPHTCQELLEAVQQ